MKGIAPFSEQLHFYQWAGLVNAFYFGAEMAFIIWLALYFQQMRANVENCVVSIRVGIFSEVYSCFADISLAVDYSAMKEIYFSQEVIDKGCGGPLINLFGFADLFDPSCIHYYHPIGDFQRLFLVVGYKDAGYVYLIM